MDGTIVVNKKGLAEMRGVDNGGPGKILQETNSYIVIKWPAHTYWSGIGSRSYASPEICVYSKEPKLGLSEIKSYPDGAYCEELISWEVKKRRGSRN